MSTCLRPFFSREAPDFLPRTSLSAVTELTKLGLAYVFANVVLSKGDGFNFPRGIEGCFSIFIRARVLRCYFPGMKEWKSTPTSPAGYCFTLHCFRITRHCVSSAIFPNDASTDFTNIIHADGGD